MNIEIKFRAWQKYSKQMLSDIETHRDLNLNHCIDLHNLGHEVELMQYTGLKDRNGIEIYEGDICLINPDDDSYRDVVVKDKNFIELSRYKNNCVTNCSLYENSNMLEVIGNIYEHPHLIAGSNAV